MHSIESRFVAGQSAILFGGVYVCTFQPGTTLCTLLKVDLLQDSQLYCLEACMCALSSPEILQAVAVKGLIIIIIDQYYSVLMDVLTVAN